jgi:hypothetical protein
MRSIETLPAPDLSASDDDEWMRERGAFHRLLPELLRDHRGEFVAIHEGRVVGSGVDKVEVARLLPAVRLHPDLRQPGRGRPSRTPPNPFAAPARWAVGKIRYAYNRQVDPPAPFVHVSIRRPGDGPSLDDLPAQITRPPTGR